MKAIKSEGKWVVDMNSKVKWRVDRISETKVKWSEMVRGSLGQWRASSFRNGCIPSKFCNLCIFVWFMCSYYRFMYFYCYLCVVFDPDSCKMGTGIFPGVKSGRGVLLNNHPLPVPWSRKSRAIPRLHLWAVRPVQSLSVCTRVHLTPQPLLVPWSRKSRTIPLLPVWAVQPVQSLSACTRLHLTPHHF